MRAHLFSQRCLSVKRNPPYLESPMFVCSNIFDMFSDVAYSILVCSLQASGNHGLKVILWFMTISKLPLFLMVLKQPLYVILHVLMGIQMGISSITFTRLNNNNQTVRNDQEVSPAINQ